MPADPAAGDVGAFNETIHAPLRFRICGLLRNVEGADFAAVRDSLAVSDATVSKHVKVLVDAGLVSVTKASSLNRNDERRITWLALTDRGSIEFDAHLAALRSIASGFAG